MRTAPVVKTKPRCLPGLAGMALAVVIAVAAAAIEPPPRTSARVGLGGADADGIAAVTREAARTPRRIVVKLRPGIGACLACRIAERKSLDDLAPGTRLGALNRRHGVRRAWPLVADAPGSMRPRSRAASEALRVRTRSGARAARASHGRPAPDFERTYVLELRRRGDMDAVAREYAADPAVEYAEPDGTVEATYVPNDTFLATTGSWGQTFADLWGITRIGAPVAWDVTRGAGVVVAITDTGIDYDHPDLAANVWTNPGEIPGNGMDDDGNGYVDDVRGWDFSADDADPLDDHAHGTHVAGTVAAVGDNGLGVVGVAYESRVMALRGLNTYGFGSYSELAAAILYAVDNGADVINASWGGGFSQTIHDAIATAHAAGVVFVAAAGNSARNVSLAHPAGDAGAITVSAYTSADVRASFSNFGLGVDVAAPGGGDAPPPADNKRPLYSILSLHSGAIAPGNDWSSYLILGQGGYLRLGGTSMAAPHVSGVAALLLGRDPTLGVEQIRQLLRTTARDVSAPGPDTDSGFGMVDAGAAVAAPAPLAARILSPRNARLVGQVSVPIIGSAFGPGFGSYSIDVRPAADATAWGAVNTDASVPVEEGVLADWDVSAVPDGDYVLRLTARRGAELFVDFAEVSLANVTIDTPAPEAAIRPDGPVEIRGTAAGGGFIGYVVEVRKLADGGSWTSDGITLAAPAGTPVRNAVLATYDASGITQGARVDFRLTVQNALGNVVVERSGSVIDPTLRPGWPQPIASVADAEYLTVYDLDGDGLQEILVGSGDEVIVFEPDGTVRPGWPQTVATNEFPFVVTRGSPIVADVTDDGRPEVIATNLNQVLVWSADGVMRPGFPRTIDAFTRSINCYVLAGNFDADPKREILAHSIVGSEILDGDGSRLVTLNNGFACCGAAVADVDGDGIDEFAFIDDPHPPFGGGSSSVELHSHTGGLLFSKGAGKVKFFAHTSVADLNGDGIMDLVSYKEDRYKTRMRARAVGVDGRRMSAALSPVPSGRSDETNCQFSFADIDGDGRVEAYAYETRESPIEGEPVIGYVRVHLPDRRADAPLISHQLFDRIYETGAIAIGDLDGDASQDLLVGVDGAVCPPASVSCTIHKLRYGLVAHRAGGSMLPGFPKALPQFIDTSGTSGVIIRVGIDDPRYNSPTITDLDGDGLREVVWVDAGARTGPKVFVWNVDGIPGPLKADWPGYHGDERHSYAMPIGGR